MALAGGTIEARLPRVSHRRAQGGREPVQRSPRKRAPRCYETRWADALPERAWALICRSIEALRSAKVSFMLGGGFALASYIGRWRDTKDIDFYIKPEARDQAIAALSDAGFADYYRKQPYDRKWIYRSFKSGVIVDLIWSMANQRAQVDELWFARVGSLTVRGQSLRIIPIEEFLWCKLYVLQKDRCDWTDLFNLVHARGQELDWKHVLWRLQEDEPLLKAMLTVYGWLCPEQASSLPAWLRTQLGLARWRFGPHRRDHVRLLDSRHWFARRVPRGRKLEV
jgi:hypothetical protein